MNATQDPNAYARTRYATNEKVRQYHIEYAKAWSRNNRDYMNLLNKAKRQDATPEMKAKAREKDRAQRALNPLKQYTDAQCLTVRTFVNRQPPSTKAMKNRRGCTVPEFVAYLEVHMLPGMKWEEFRITWTLKAVEHYKSFKDSEKHLAFHYTNFTPVWKPIK